MRMTKFEKLGEETSQLGFGCMRLPMKDGAVDREEAMAMVDYSMKHGITYYDTAFTYHGGESEKFLGEALKKYPRDSYTIATKLPIWMINTQEDMEKVFNTQLERLQETCIDFYLIHAVDLARYEKCKTLDVFKFLEKKREEGKIKYIGFSFHDIWENFEQIVDGYGWDFVQIQLNYIDYKIMGADKLYKVLEDRNIPCVVMEPIRGGYLANLPEEMSKPFHQYAPEKSNASWALRWVAQFPNVKVVLSGMSNMPQMIDNVQTIAGAFELNQQEEKIVTQVAEKILSVASIPCTGCGYCMPCFRGVDIPRIFAIYNDLKMFGNAWRSYNEYHVYFKEENKASQCVTCGVCAKKCPQQINIPEMLTLAHDTLEGLKVQFANDPRTKTTL